MRRNLYLLAVMAGVAAVAQPGSTQQQPGRPAAERSAPKGKARPDRAADEAAIRANIDRFAKARVHLAP